MRGVRPTRTCRSGLGRSGGRIRLPYLDAGYDTVTIANMGPHYRSMIDFYGSVIIPRLKDGED
ncbi:hypothetical protein GCM10011492_27410 [Flexivirga endophytica]|uniref:Uncharacterized protein n=1 Tax=Flexivirga endophytica TaxID=1849103 RepID=A0A916TAJ8_9MICO|nr:hypothetical protein GCM10011492_27410 [Flexivirga endophytica]GHB43062.1 hypothetical protein GCM10008112_09790 [Flexivirga endophytica]